LDTKRVALCIPWRATRERVPLLAQVLEWYADCAPMRTFLGDSRSDTFSRAQAINNAVLEAYREGYTTVIINDADTIPEKDPLELAVKLTELDGKPRLPYHKYYLLNQQETYKFVRGAWFDLRASWVYPSVSGVMVINTPWFEAKGGFDTRYVGWGHEDSDFAALAQFERVQGTVYSMWHPQSERGEQTEANHRLYKEKYGQLD